MTWRLFECFVGQRETDAILVFLSCAVRIAVYSIPLRQSTSAHLFAVKIYCVNQLPSGYEP